MWRDDQLLDTVPDWVTFTEVEVENVFFTAIMMGEFVQTTQNDAGFYHFSVDWVSTSYPELLRINVIDTSLEINPEVDCNNPEFIPIYYDYYTGVETAFTHETLTYVIGLDTGMYFYVPYFVVASTYEYGNGVSCGQVTAQISDVFFDDEPTFANLDPNLMSVSDDLLSVEFYPNDNSMVGVYEIVVDINYQGYDSYTQKTNVTIEVIHMCQWNEIMLSDVYY